MFLTYHLKSFLNIHQYVYDIDEDLHYLNDIILMPRNNKILLSKKRLSNYLLELYNQVIH
jgi:hypothetical protein